MESRQGKESQKWTFMLKVAMNETNARAVYRIKKILGVGQVHAVDKLGMVVYKLSDREKIKRRIFPLLASFPFRGVKH